MLRNVLRHIFPDDKVTQTFQMGRERLMYVVNYEMFSHCKQSVKVLIN